MSALDTVQAAYGDAVQDWHLALAQECDRTSAKAAAARINYSGAVVSEVLRNKYLGNVERVAEAVRGALLGATVECPVLGELARDHCLAEQRKTHRATSSVRARLHAACRGGCPHSRIGGDHG